MSDTCQSCGVPYVDHLGLQGTCEELQEAKKTIEEYRAYVDDLITKRAESMGLIPPRRTLQVDELAEIIRRVDGNHSLGAGVLAEKIIEEIQKLMKGQ